MVFNSYVGPHFENCHTVWNNTSSENIYKISKLQRRACKFILAQDYKDFQEDLERLYILYFDHINCLNQ